MAAAERSDPERPASTAHSPRDGDGDRSDLVGPEEARHLAEASCSSIIDFSSDAFVSVDEEQRIILFNQGAETAFGYKADAVIGKPLDILIPEEFRELHRERVRAFARSGVRARRMARDCNIIGRRADGDRFQADASISQIEVDGRKIFTAALRDITMEVRTAALGQFLTEASQSLAESVACEDVLRKLMEFTVPRLADYSLLDLLDDEGRVTRPIAAHRDSRLQSFVDDLRNFPAADQEAGPAKVLRSGEAEIVPEVDAGWLRAVARDAGHYRLLLRLAPRSIIILPLRARAQLIGAITCAFVTTERRYDPELLSFAERLAARAALAIDNALLYHELRGAVRTRDEVLRIVAHDLRNPLNTITLTAGVLAETMPPEIVRHYGSQLDVIRRSTQQANRLIADLLDATRIREGKLTVQLRPIGTTPLVQEVVDLQRTLVEGRGLHLEQRLPPSLPAISADRDRILQVFANLIGNALKFTPTGGRITLQARAEDDEVHFTVADTGPGIPARSIPRIFDAFWQGQESGGGTGLGLAICKAIVTAHGGRIWAESQVGGGTAVHFTIPVAASPP
jgi:PAS domain S-box-containing protein